MSYIILIIIYILFSSCDFENKKRIQGEGKKSSEIISIPQDSSSAEGAEKKSQGEGPWDVSKFRYQGVINSDDESNPSVLGNVSQDSSLHIQVKLDKRWGDYHIPTVIRLPSGTQCYLQGHLGFSFEQTPMLFVRDLGGEFRRLEILLDEEAFLLEDLIRTRSVRTYWRKEIFHILIDGPWGIIWVEEKESLSLSLRIAPFDESGLFIKIMELKPPSCGGMADRRSFHENFSISVDSIITNQTKEGVGMMRFIDISFYFWIGLASYLLVIPQRAYAFSKIINGLESITSSYLVPLAGAVAGASFILFVTMSYFRQEEYQRKIVNVLILAVITGSGLEMVKKVIQHFS